MTYCLSKCFPGCMEKPSGLTWKKTITGMFTNKQRIVDPCNKYITSQAIQLCLLETASITYLCSCEELRDQRELSQRWTPWGEVPESCESVAASPSSSSVLSVDSWVSGVTKLLLLLWSEWAQISEVRRRNKRLSLSVTSLIEWIFGNRLNVACAAAAGVSVSFWSGWTTSLSWWFSGLVQLTGLDWTSGCSGLLLHHLYL